VRCLPKKLGIEKLVEFPGFLTDIEGAIHGLDLLVHASIIGESLNQIIIEGMAKPIVAANGGGVPEIVRQNGNLGCDGRRASHGGCHI
jgi:glycosyltransferase involved in cell wall biosynthesis